MHNNISSKVVGSRVWQSASFFYGVSLLLFNSRGKDITQNRKWAQNTPISTMNCSKQAQIIMQLLILFTLLYLQVTLAANDNDLIVQKDFEQTLETKELPKEYESFLSNEKLLVRNIVREISNNNNNNNLINNKRESLSFNYDNSLDDLGSESSLSTVISNKFLEETGSTELSLASKQQQQQQSEEVTSSKNNNSESNNNYEQHHKNLFKNRNIFYKITMYTLNPILFYIDYIYGTVFIIGVIGNLAVIYFIAVRSNSSKSEFERVTDFYICNLAGADLMFISGLPFIIMQHITGKWVLGDLACKMYMSSTSLNQFASSFLLVAMGFDRFMAVCLPIYAQKFRQLKSAIKVCGLIWLISIPLMSPIFNYSKLEDNSLCTIGWPDSKYISYGAVFTMYSFAFGFAMPLLLIAGFYLSILRKLRSTTNCPFNSTSARRTKNSEARNRKIEHLVVVIICTYTICWSPYWVCQLIISLVDENDMDPILYSIFSIATSLSYANSAVNPIIYAFLNDNFKRRYLQSYRSFILVKIVRGCLYNNSSLEAINKINSNSNNRASVENDISKIRNINKQANNQYHQSAIHYDQTGTTACCSEQLDDNLMINDSHQKNSNSKVTVVVNEPLSRIQNSILNKQQMANVNMKTHTLSYNKDNPTTTVTATNTITRETSIDDQKGDNIIISVATKDDRNFENQKFNISVNENSFIYINNGQYLDTKNKKHGITI